MMLRPFLLVAIENDRIMDLSNNFAIGFSL